MRQRSTRWIALLVLAGLWSRAVAQQAPMVSPAGPSGQLPEITAELDNYVRDLEYPQLERSLARFKASSDVDYFQGILANREGRVEASAALLKKVVPRIRASHPRRAAIALHALADDYVKLYDYDKAINAYQDLMQHFAPLLGDAERQSTRDDYHTVALLQGAPPQTVSFDGPIDLPVHRNAVLGTLETTLTVRGVTEPWILDTGANFSTVSASFAHRLGLQLSKNEAQTQGITGAENRLRIAILPELKLGGATVRNVVLLVLDDSSLNVLVGPKSSYQINAILGYPVLRALERITFTSDGHFLAGPGSSSSRDGARLFMAFLTPLLQCKVEGRDVPFSFDTGAGNSTYSVRYLRAFPAQFRGLHKRLYIMGGAGGSRRMQVYYLPHAQLGIGPTVVTLENVPVVPALGMNGDRLFGNLGRDVIAPYHSFTIDFANMRFQLGDKVPD